MKGSRRPTPRQQQVLAYIAQYASEHERPPTFREIAEACGMCSPSVASHHVARLERWGYLTRQKGISRGLNLTARGNRQACRTARVAGDETADPAGHDRQRAPAGSTR